MPHIAKLPDNARYTFRVKAGALLALVGIADLFLYGSTIGSQMGVFALFWLAALTMARPAVRRGKPALVALTCAAFYAAILFDDPSLLAAMLFLIAIGSAALLPRHVFDHAGLWFARLAALAARGLFRLPGDIGRVHALPSRGGLALRSIGANLALPVLGGGLFLSLFANANPVLGSALESVRTPGIGPVIRHALLWLLVIALVWPTFRPAAIRFAADREPLVGNLPELPVTTLVLALVTFNAIFALQNMSDAIFLWSGAPLPGSITLADYAHRGAYTLIATALLAGLFVIVALRPDTAAARSPLLRRLVLLWVAQNIFLVASSALRLVDYIEVYSLTVLRISALAWMALVATGLALICWRFLANRSAAWLINANALAAALVLSAASVVDLGAVAATWNVRHLDGPAKLDLCYLDRLDDSALIPLLELRDATIGEKTRDRVIYLGNKEYRALRTRQSDWRGWTWRGARRLARAEELLAGDTRTAAAAPDGRLCGGEIIPPPPPVEVEIAPPAPPVPLTPEQNQ